MFWHVPECSMFEVLSTADLSSVRYKTSTWNEIKELMKSNYMIVPSVLSESQKNMTWNDRWETKLFLEDTELHAGTEVKWTTLIKFSLLDVIKCFTRLWTKSCFLFSLSFLHVFCSIFWRKIRKIPVQLWWLYFGYA